MAYIVDPINNTLIDDEKPFKKKEVPTRKPNALPPKTKQYKSLKMVELQLFRDPKTLMREYKE